jgi:hypothetical protein
MGPTYNNTTNHWTNDLVEKDQKIKRKPNGSKSAIGCKPDRKNLIKIICQTYRSQLWKERKRKKAFSG